MDKSNIGKNIKRYRLLNGWTQEELANESGLSKNAIYNYENEKRIPNMTILKKICDALNIDYNAIMSEDLDNSKFLEGISLAKDLLSENPNDAFTHRFLGLTYSLLKEYNKSIEHYLKSIELYDKSIEAYIALGNIFLEINEYDKAVVYYNKAIELDDKCIEAYTRREFIFNNVPKYNLLIRDSTESSNNVQNSEIIELEKIKHIDTINNDLLNKLSAKAKKLNNNELEAIINIIDIFNKQKEENK
ncbi:helix-turn-helix transcriptional regulator [Clostridioides difficile]|uniref:helix-turn-helix transcriptional regulator n=1 Tax=Clostridioides difficile TaxID=1496 RepID=UPI000944FA3F|nr:helix-turn-helix transcriptional regulator [Clostridioides difficile]EIS9524139.1 helix-turn-helix transcriptional regulator [Clostridioides difficile]EIS9625716.1 helix-turn-helix transcriptional regulator [Clostridioides difficile]EJX3464888.1 helix-turn-helix transcriptional regulator [Clostridioides difficile]MDM9773521.1 helix-turn-helix transcriptional regulator [Clostridioides difficile]MDO0132470.1 helix-turn-helix transcriptional regulator [Clostridioides difficile]